jgi:hypothetical protein
MYRIGECRGCCRHCKLNATATSNNTRTSFPRVKHFPPVSNEIDWTGSNRSQGSNIPSENMCTGPTSRHCFKVTVRVRQMRTRELSHRYWNVCIVRIRYKRAFEPKACWRTVPAKNHFVLQQVCTSLQETACWPIPRFRGTAACK